MILIFYNSESTVFHLNVDKMHVIGEALISISSAHDFLEATIFTITVKCRCAKLLFNCI